MSTLDTLIPLLSTAFGGGIAIAANYMIHRQGLHEERRAIANAFAGEIDAILRIADSRQYPAFLQDLVRQNADNSPPMLPIIAIRMDYFSVHRNCITKIGMLPGQLPSMIARFYTQTNSIMEDLKSIHSGEWNHRPDAEKRRGVIEMDSLLTDTLALGRETGIGGCARGSW